MIEQVGIIGVGHLACYLVEGLRRASPTMEIVLSPRNAARSASMADRFAAHVAADNQAVVDAAEIVLLTTRPDDAVEACQPLDFRSGQIVVSVAAGLLMEALLPTVTPATLLRAMPVSCAAVNQSPTLLHPDHPAVRSLFELLGTAHVLDSEEQFTAASTLAAYYAWLFAQMDDAVQWTAAAGVPDEIARTLVLETFQGAAAVALVRSDESLGAIFQTLATPGGITELGFGALQNRGALLAWTEALDAVLGQLTMS